ncbi:methyltransferase type 12 [Steroidobacter denitrificans]|uniref:Methyltransferase type 12 n=2 Tax=Steroidobacter denitrificans TaxID=465721 RepID=A0A127F9Z3_STEDE|nr:methyltransferase type 12 [Steroidobacter denitrificans]
MYFERRSMLLGMMDTAIAGIKAERICDFGCGDGYYMAHFSAKFPGKQWTGIDMSASMIERARIGCPHAEFHVSNDGIPTGKKFDLVYAIAVFAHILDDKILDKLVNGIAEALRPGGHFILFEQTGAAASGSTWRRRPAEEYISLMSRNGLDLTNRSLIAFPMHRRFEKSILGWYRRYLCSGDDLNARAIYSNRSLLFRSLSRLALILDGKRVRSDDGLIDGNTFYIFKRRSYVNSM